MIARLRDWWWRVTHPDVTRTLAIVEEVGTIPTDHDATSPR